MKVELDLIFNDIYKFLASISYANDYEIDCIYLEWYKLFRHVINL